MLHKNVSNRTVKELNLTMTVLTFYFKKKVQLKSLNLHVFYISVDTINIFCQRKYK